MQAFPNRRGYTRQHPAKAGSETTQHYLPWKAVSSGVTHYHIELPRHDVLLTEGVPAEFCLDTSDRSNFDNGGGVVRLHPDSTTLGWEAYGCVPLVVTGPELETAWRCVNARAA